MIYYIRADLAYLPAYQDHLPNGLRDKFYFRDTRLHRYGVVYLYEKETYHWYDGNKYPLLS